jgi:hypothetical protein
VPAAPVTDTTPAPSAPAVIDLDGQFHAVPVAHERPTVPSSATLAVLSLQYYLRASSYQPPVLARVTWSAASNTFRPIGPAPIHQGAVAWVLVFHEIPKGGCFFPGSAAPAPSGPVLDSDAVIVDATSGAAAIYLGRHPRCGRWTEPTIDAAGRHWSVPWTQAGPTTVRVTLPPCGVVTGSGTSNDQLSVIAGTPLDVPCASRPTTAVTGDITSFDWTHLTHAPVGPVCSTPAPDASGPPVELPAVPGCVRLR